MAHQTREQFRSADRQRQTTEAPSLGFSGFQVTFKKVSPKWQALNEGHSFAA